MNVAETVTTIVSLLGGPKINAEDIEWAADIPAGQRLLEWLAAQVSTGEVDDDGSDASYKVRAALTGVALEGEELQMLRRATGKHAGTNSDASAPTEFGPQVPPEYIPPWRLRV
ncbi:hypothetical protein B0H10DRAFT_1978800 [Mycena sp. CBHHK59/15]|nr:hypothetical protein B0H10DRAFT_1978800 [Mycena sp. CBHHK59/15]